MRYDHKKAMRYDQKKTIRAIRDYLALPVLKQKYQRRLKQVITRNVTASDGVSRKVVGKIWDDEFRIYRVHGDVTNREALEETAQILAFELRVSNIVYTNI